MRGEADRVREVLHGEHSGCYDYEDGNHYLTDGRVKFIWYSQTGREQLFDLESDPEETRDLARGDGAEGRVAPWRTRLIEILKDRPEGCSDGTRLIAGRPHEELIPGYEPGGMYPFL